MNNLGIRETDGRYLSASAIVLDDCEIGRDCLIAAGTVVPPGTRVPDGKVVLGMPGRVVRDIRPEERAMTAEIAGDYLSLARRHATGEFPLYGA